MATEKLTKSKIDGLPIPATGQKFYRDSALRGFAVRVTSNGAKSFILERRVNGRVKRYTVARVGDLTVDQAREEAEKLVAEIAKGMDPQAEKRKRIAESLTLGEAVQEYLEDRAGGEKPLKPRTIKDVDEAMATVESWKKRRLTDLTPDAVLKKHRELSAASPARANLTMRYLRMIWNHARVKHAAPNGEPILPPSPVTRMSETKAWNKVERRKTVIRREDLKAWLSAVRALENPIMRDFFQLLVLTGLRKTEALDLTWDRVNLGKTPLRVKGLKGEPMTIEPMSLLILDTKAKRPHALPMGTHLAELLTARKALLEAAREKAQRENPKEELPPALWVFGDHIGRRLSWLRYSQDRVKKASDVEFCLHDLRRTFATIAESLDLSVYAVKRLLNHSTANDVTAGYIVSDTDRLRETMQRIEDTILRLGGVKGGGAVIEFRSATA